MELALFVLLGPCWYDGIIDIIAIFHDETIKPMMMKRINYDKSEFIVKGTTKNLEKHR